MSLAPLFITGAAGFIGSNFVRLALAHGYSVVGLDLFTYAGHAENLEYLPKGNFTLVKGNICDKGLITELLQKHRPRALINFAAESHVDRSIEGPAVFVETNVLGTANLLHASLQHWNDLSLGEKSNFRYVQISTDEVYGQLPLEGTDKFRENTPLDPSSPYSASKAGGDQLVQAWNHTYKLPTIITRCSNNYGAYQFPEKLIPTIITCALEGKSLPVYGQGLNVRDWIHVQDHCRGILLALEKGSPGAVYCFGGRSERSNIEVVKIICKLLDVLAPRSDKRSYQEQIAYVTDRLGHDLRYAIDDSKAERELGFTHKHRFEEGLRETVMWYLDQRDWSQKVLANARARTQTIAASQKEKA